LACIWEQVCLATNQIVWSVTACADKPITAQALVRVITTLLEKMQINTLCEELDLTYIIAGVARFRVNILNQLKGQGIVFLVLPEQIKT